MLSAVSGAVHKRFGSQGGGGLSSADILRTKGRVRKASSDMDVRIFWLKKVLKKFLLQFPS